MTQTTSILLIDDDRELLRATAQTLELAGLHVIPCSSAQDALPKIQPDFDGVVVSDIRMPGMDGLELFKRIMALDPELPVILVLSLIHI